MLQCSADGWSKNPSAPVTSPTTNAPVEAPVVGPTNPPVSSPTMQPVTGDDDYCCTFDFYHCGFDSFCNMDVSNCQTGCGGSWVSKDDSAMQCISKYGECTKNEGVCCGSLECNGDQNYKQCT